MTGTAVLPCSADRPAAGQREKLARRAGFLGGCLGLLAGTAQAGIGSRIPRWSGSKADPLALGLLTVLLSGVALAGVASLLRRTERTAEKRIAAGVAMLVPAALCFSTAGRLWYLPGVLLLTAAGALVSTGERGDLRRVASRSWSYALLAVLGGLQLLMAVASAPSGTLLLGVVGALIVLGACWARSRRSRLLLVAVATLPFAVLTWTSLASPLLAVIALGLAAGLPPAEARADGRPARPATRSPT